LSDRTALPRLDPARYGKTGRSRLFIFLAFPFSTQRQVKKPVLHGDRLKNLSHESHGSRPIGSPERLVSTGFWRKAGFFPFFSAFSISLSIRFFGMIERRGG
jgi:hypothetical protein